MMKLIARERNLLRKRARALMRKATGDMMHDSSHIERVLKISREVYKSLNNKRINWDLVEQAALWHDISRINNRGSTLFMYLFDDLLSIKIIRREFSKLRISKQFTQKVCDVIIGHKLYSLTKRTAENHIFHDADTLDIYSVGRYKQAIKYLKTSWFSKLPPKKIGFVKFIMNLYVLLAVLIYHSMQYRQLTFDKSRKIYNRKMRELVKFFHKRKSNYFISDFNVRLMEKRLARYKTA